MKNYNYNLKSMNLKRKVEGAQMKESYVILI